MTIFLKQMLSKWRTMVNNQFKPVRYKKNSLYKEQIRYMLTRNSGYKEQISNVPMSSL
jgi:hypothetical protein